ncbi:hypothetical protein GCM10011399_37780 [Subtercola lobariae]|uniref:Uncharacterized protein n=1 Tax=Subtercola lobariae TaxID=1588641 RepID=A0A917BFH3_9MICO|nr:hypothetical protein GCM10011399_37780 [Subtercola lobariae]
MFATIFGRNFAESALLPPGRLEFVGEATPGVQPHAGLDSAAGAGPVVRKHGCDETELRRVRAPDGVGFGMEHFHHLYWSEDFLLNDWCVRVYDFEKGRSASRAYCSWRDR